MAELARVEGHWDHTVRSEICMFQPGNPCDYHYHDGDEYWVVFRGHFNLDYHVSSALRDLASCWPSARATSTALLHPEDVMQAIVLRTPPEGPRRATATSTGSATATPIPDRDIPESVWKAFARARASKPERRSSPRTAGAVTSRRTQPWGDE